jgi:hypothetical protein
MLRVPGTLFLYRQDLHGPSVGEHIGQGPEAFASNLNVG